MAETPKGPAQPAAAPAPAQNAAEQLGNALLAATDALTAASARLESQAPVKVPMHLAIIRSPWNPEGKKGDRKRLKRPTFQNGTPLSEKTLTEEEIDLFNQLRAGRYGPDRKYVVIVRPSDRAVTLRYNNKTVEDRMAILTESKGEGITGLLKMIVAEAADRKANPKKYENEDIEAVS